MTHILLPTEIASDDDPDSDLQHIINEYLERLFDEATA